MTDITLKRLVHEPVSETRYHWPWEALPRKTSLNMEGSTREPCTCSAIVLLDAGILTFRTARPEDEKCLSPIPFSLSFNGPPGCSMQVSERGLR